MLYIHKSCFFSLSKMDFITFLYCMYLLNVESIACNADMAKKKTLIQLN